MEIEIGTESEKEGCTPGARIFLTAFCSIFLLVGAGILIGIGQDALETIDTYT
jgi:hypothetical protein